MGRLRYIDEYDLPLIAKSKCSVKKTHKVAIMTVFDGRVMKWGVYYRLCKHTALHACLTGNSKLTCLKDIYRRSQKFYSTVLCNQQHEIFIIKSKL